MSWKNILKDDRSYNLFFSYGFLLMVGKMMYYCSVLMFSIYLSALTNSCSIDFYVFLFVKKISSASWWYNLDDSICASVVSKRVQKLFLLTVMAKLIGLQGPSLLIFSRYAALGKTRSCYLLYKDVNRNPL